MGDNRSSCFHEKAVFRFAMADNELNIPESPATESVEPVPSPGEDGATFAPGDFRAEAVKDPSAALGIDPDFNFAEQYPDAFKKINEVVGTYFNDAQYDSKDGFDFKGFVSLEKLVDPALFGNHSEAAKIVSASFGTVFSHETSAEVAQKIQSFPAPETVQQGLAQLTEALDLQAGYFHVTEGEGRGRAFKKDRLEPTKARLQEIGDSLALEGVTNPEERETVLINRQFTIAVAKQLFAEGALELKDIPKFARLLKISQGLSNQEALSSLSESLSDEEMKILHQATEQTIQNRLERPPPLWVMVKSGDIEESEAKEITSGRVRDYDSYLRRVCGTKYTSSNQTAFSPSSDHYFASSEGATVGRNLSTADGLLAGVLGSARTRQNMEPTLELLELMDQSFRMSSNPEERVRGLEKYFEEVAQLLLQSDREREVKEQKEAQLGFDDSLRDRIKRHLEQTLARLGMQDEVLDHTLLELSNPDNPLTCYVKIDDIIALARARMEADGVDPNSLPKTLESVVAPDPFKPDSLPGDA